MASFHRALFLARRRAERALAARPDSYVVSLSAWTLGYKGMMLPAALPEFFPDLARAEMASSVVVFHHRFSTNTAPAWKLAQPFRLLAHNGEINTIEGNRRWASARAAKWRQIASEVAHDLFDQAPANAVSTAERVAARRGENATFDRFAPSAWLGGVMRIALRQCRNRRWTEADQRVGLLNDIALERTAQPAFVARNREFVLGQGEVVEANRGGP